MKASDWRLRCIAALRAKTVERGCTIGEAEAAAQKARALLREEMVEALNAVFEGRQVALRAVAQEMKGDGP